MVALHQHGTLNFPELSTKSCWGSPFCIFVNARRDRCKKISIYVAPPHFPLQFSLSVSNHSVSPYDFSQHLQPTFTTTLCPLQAVLAFPWSPAFPSIQPPNFWRISEHNLAASLQWSWHWTGKIQPPQTPLLGGCWSPPGAEGPATGTAQLWSRAGRCLLFPCFRTALPHLVWSRV